jgi:hypothetical protein
VKYSRVRGDFACKHCWAVVLQRVAQLLSKVLTGENSGVSGELACKHHAGSVVQLLSKVLQT